MLSKFRLVMTYRTNVSLSFQNDMSKKASSFFQTGLFPRLLPGNLYILYIPYIYIVVLCQTTDNKFCTYCKKRYLVDDYCI